MNADVEAMTDVHLDGANRDEPTSVHDRHTDKEGHSRHSSRSSRASRSRSPSRRHSSSRSHRSHRSHSRHSRHYRSRSRDRDRERDRDRRRRDRSRSRRDDRRSRYDSRERRSSREYRRRSPSPRRPMRSMEGPGPRRRGRGRSPSPPMPAPDVDRRTVFVAQLAQSLRERDLEDFFSSAGKVLRTALIKNKNGRPKGVGYVEFQHEDSVSTALAMSGQELLGIPIRVDLTEAEKNRAALEEQQRRNAALNPKMLYQHRLCIEFLDIQLTEEDIRKVFGAFGTIENLDLHKGDGETKPFSKAFIQYSSPNDAQRAEQQLNGFELAGQKLKVARVTEENSALMNHINLDDEDSKEISLSAMDRAELMKKLANRQTDTSMEDRNVPVVNTMIAPTVPQPFVPEQLSRILQLSNMFNPDDETEPGWAKELEGDIREECTKYGSIETIHLLEDSMGVVVLKYEAIPFAEKAKKDLDGRWFGGRQIKAGYMSEAMYNAQYSK